MYSKKNARSICTTISRIDFDDAGVNEGVPEGERMPVIARRCPTFNHVTQHFAKYLILPDHLRISSCSAGW
jgi:hypothetical protein